MTLEELSSIEEIKQLKARYLRAMDTKDWPLLEQVFAADAMLDVRGGVSDKSGRAANESMETGELICGRDNILRFMSRNLQPLQCAHYALCPEITVETPDFARGIWAQHDYLYFPAGSTNRVLRGYGYYHESYTRIDGNWVVKTLKLARLFVDMS